MNRVSGRTGRPTKLTPEVHDTIVDALRAGNYIETAAALAGVSKVSLYAWLKIGNNPRLKKDSTPYKEDEPYVRFLSCVKKAQARSEEHTSELQSRGHL